MRRRNIYILPVLIFCLINGTNMSPLVYFSVAYSAITNTLLFICSSSQTPDHHFVVFLCGDEKIPIYYMTLENNTCYESKTPCARETFECSSDGKSFQWSSCPSEIEFNDSQILHCQMRFRTSSGRTDKVTTTIKWNGTEFVFSSQNVETLGNDDKETNKTSNMETSKGMITGIAVGISILVVFLVIVAIIIKKKQNQKQSASKDDKLQATSLLQPKTPDDEENKKLQMIITVKILREDDESKELQTIDMEDSGQSVLKVPIGVEDTEQSLLKVPTDPHHNQINKTFKRSCSQESDTSQRSC